MSVGSSSTAVVRSLAAVDARLDALAASLGDAPALAWGLAVLWYGVGDTATTLVGLHAPGAAEAGPVVGRALGTHPFVGLAAVKLVTFAVCFTLWKASPRPYRVGVPLGLVTTGAVVTLWNLAVILS